jgi:hypothetical protein
MAWTNKQKQIAVKACRAAGITEEQRIDLILRNFQHANHGGDITSTSPRLTNQDFEQFMAVVEKFAGGKVLHFTERYWEGHASDRLSRMRHKAAGIASALEAAGRLAPGGAGLAGWIEKRVSAGATRRIEDLEYHGLLALILGLEAYAHQSGVTLQSDHAGDPHANDATLPAADPPSASSLLPIVEQRSSCEDLSGDQPHLFQKNQTCEASALVGRSPAPSKF